jgi:cysteine synthase
MVDVSILSPNPNVRLVAKLESQNPFGSVKDRIAKSMIEDAERTGRLVPGQRILEPSSGNTGIALAAIAKMKGYPITILMPTSVSIERRQMLEVFGADIILTPGEVVHKRWLHNILNGASCISTQTMQTRVHILKVLAQRSGAIVLKSLTLLLG